MQSKEREIEAKYWREQQKCLKRKMPQEWGTLLKRKPTKHTLI
jgi:hypothetical protein